MRRQNRFIRFLRKLAINLSLIKELSVEEALEAIKEDTRLTKLKEDISRIRNSGDYFPDYSRSPRFEEYKLVEKRDEQFHEVRWEPRTTFIPIPVEEQEWRAAIRHELYLAQQKNKPQGHQMHLF